MRTCMHCGEAIARRVPVVTLSNTDASGRRHTAHWHLHYCHHVDPLYRLMAREPRVTPEIIEAIKVRVQRRAALAALGVKP